MIGRPFVFVFLFYLEFITNHSGIPPGMCFKALRYRCNSSMEEIRCIFGLFALRSVRRNSIMCDYSLYEFPNRVAREREELITYRFPLGSMGLVSPVEFKNAHGNENVESNPSDEGYWGPVRSPWELSRYRLRDQSSVCAVCVPPGARLVLKDISPLMQRDRGLAGGRANRCRQLLRWQPRPSPWRGQEGLPFVLA